MLAVNFTRFTCLITLLVCLLGDNPASCATPKGTESNGTDHNYISALAAANRFLEAWASQDQGAGLVMLTDAAKQHASEARLQRFFNPPPGTQQSFEINRGRRLKDGHYSFPVALFEITPEKVRTHPRCSTIIVTRTSKDEWAVDRLP